VACGESGESLGTKGWSSVFWVPEEVTIDGAEDGEENEDVDGLDVGSEEDKDEKVEECVGAGEGAFQFAGTVRRASVSSGTIYMIASFFLSRSD
jgi:hypothetical protein